MRALLLAAALTAGCAPDPRPRVEVVDAAPRVLDATQPTGRDLTLTVRYHDGDGDLGGGWAHVHDCRDVALENLLELPAIASTEAVAARVPIEGLLELTVRQVLPAPSGAPPPACASSGALPPGQTVFCVELEDAAGSRSSASCTATIVVGE